MKRLVLLSIFGILTSAALGCGTVRMWHQRYFEAATDQERLNALKFLHCKPVVEQYLRAVRYQEENAEADLAYLLEMVDHALSQTRVTTEHSEAYEMLALKNYMVFGLYAVSDAVIEHAMLQDAIAQLLDEEYFPFSTDFAERVGVELTIFLPFDDFYTTEDYVREIGVQREALLAAKQAVFKASATYEAGTLGEVEINMLGEGNVFTMQYSPTSLQIGQNMISIPEDCLCEWEGEPEEFTRYVRLEDLNFDGSPELMVLDNAGATGNRYHQIWRYDASTSGYVYDDLLSSLSAIQTDPQKEELTTFDTQGRCARQWTTYHWEGPELVRSRAKFTQQNEETGTCELVTGYYDIEGIFVEESRVALEE